MHRPQKHDGVVYPRKEGKILWLQMKREALEKAQPPRQRNGAVNG